MNFNVNSFFSMKTEAKAELLYIWGKKIGVDLLLFYQKFDIILNIYCIEKTPKCKSKKEKGIYEQSKHKKK